MILGIIRVLVSVRAAMTALSYSEQLVAKESSEMKGM
jgi:hypothetical protein